MKFNSAGTCMILEEDPELWSTVNMPFHAGLLNFEIIQGCCINLKRLKLCHIAINE